MTTPSDTPRTDALKEPMEWDRFTAEAMALCEQMEKEIRNDYIPALMDSMATKAKLERELAAALEELAAERGKLTLVREDKAAFESASITYLHRAERAEQQLAERDAELAALRDSVEYWEGSHCGGDCLAAPCFHCDGTQHIRGRGAELEEQASERAEELAAIKAKNESLERAHASIMQAVDECGSYKP